MDAHLCDGLTADSQACSRRGVHPVDTFHFCFQHVVIYERVRMRRGPRPPERCHHITSTNNYCRNAAIPGLIQCVRHLFHNPPAAAPAAPVALLGDPIPAPAPALGAFALDNQNVHRGEVSEQTNKATEFLLKIAPAVNPWKEICGELLAAADNNMGLYIRVLDDVLKWIRTRTCRKQNDDLYKKLMYSLVTYIKKSEHKEELWKRLWQECVDSLGMCCEGHIGRLCNVLVGYVEGIGPQVSLGELMQHKMAAIAALDISEEDKKKQANEFFDTHGVPEASRVAWLEAF